ncbi:MAG: hypothetical protein ABI910_07830 [Gemmatimonadota bacterium]
MQLRTKQGLQTLRRAYAFLVTHRFQVAAGDMATHTQMLGEIVQRLEEHAKNQDVRQRLFRAETAVKRVRAAVLRQEFLRPISIAAQTMFKDDPAVGKAYDVRKTRSDEDLMQVADGVVARIGAHATKFVEKGLVPDIEQRVRDAVGQMREALVTRDLAKSATVKATAGLLDEVGRGRELMRLINTMLVPRLANDPAQLAEWRSIARFVRRQAVEREEKTSAVPAEAAPDGSSRSVPTLVPGDGAVTRTIHSDDVAA